MYLSIYPRSATLGLHFSLHPCSCYLLVLASMIVSCDFDVDPMTLTGLYELDPDIMKMCLHTKNELSRSRLSKVRALGYRQTRGVYMGGGVEANFLHFELEGNLRP